MQTYQRVEYGQKTGREGEDKQLGSSPLTMTQGGPGTTATGPTGSSRSYPKGGSLSLTPDYNPQKVPASTYAVGGV